MFLLDAVQFGLHVQSNSVRADASIENPLRIAHWTSPPVTRTNFSMFDSESVPSDFSGRRSRQAECLDNDFRITIVCACRPQFGQRLRFSKLLSSNSREDHQCHAYLSEGLPARNCFTDVSNR